jgi:hypothetical protein
VVPRDPPITHLDFYRQAQSYSVSAQADDGRGHTVVGEGWVAIPKEAGGPFQVTYVGMHIDTESSALTISKMEGMLPFNDDLGLIAADSPASAVAKAVDSPIGGACTWDYNPTTYTYTVRWYVADEYSYFTFQAQGTILEYLTVADAADTDNVATDAGVLITTTNPVSPSSGSVNLNVTVTYLGPAGVGKYVYWGVYGGTTFAGDNCASGDSSSAHVQVAYQTSGAPIDLTARAWIDPNQSGTSTPPLASPSVNVPVQGITRSLVGTSEVNGVETGTWGGFSRTWQYSLTHPPANNVKYIFVQRLTVSLTGVTDVGPSQTPYNRDPNYTPNQGKTYFEYLNSPSPTNPQDTWSWMSAPSPAARNVFYGWIDPNWGDGLQHNYAGEWEWSTEVRVYPYRVTSYMGSWTPKTKSGGVSFYAGTTKNNQTVRSGLYRTQVLKSNTDIWTGWGDPIATATYKITLQWGPDGIVREVQ